MAIGAKKFYEDKHLNIPDDKILQTENMSYINELDSIQRFIDESCEIDENGRVPVSVIKDAYNKFCLDENIPGVKPSQLRDTLSRKFEIKKDIIIQ